MIAGAVVVVLVAAIALVVGVAIAGLFNRDDPEAWANANGISLTPATRAVVVSYLGNRRGLRRIGAFGGLVLPPAVTAATGIDLRVSGLVWVLVGYLVGLVVAELTFARIPDAGPRVASLTTRRLGGYLPRRLALAQVLVPVLNIGLAVVAAVQIQHRPEPALWATGATTFQDLTAAAVVAGPLAALLAAGSLLGERVLVRRPQPIVEPDLVALDDAMRSSSVRTVAATSVATTCFLAACQLGGIGQALPTGSALQPVLWIASAVVLLGAWWAWQWWTNRGWRVRRGPAPVLEVQP